MESGERAGDVLGEYGGEFGGVITPEEFTRRFWLFDYPRSLELARLHELRAVAIEQRSRIQTIIARLDEWIASESNPKSAG